MRICICQWCKKKISENSSEVKKLYVFFINFEYICRTMKMWKRATKRRKFPDNRRGNTRIMTTFSYLNYRIINWNVFRIRKGARLKWNEGCCFLLQWKGILRFTPWKFLSFRILDSIREKLGRKLFASKFSVN